MSHHHAYLVLTYQYYHKGEQQPCVVTSLLHLNELLELILNLRFS